MNDDKASNWLSLNSFSAPFPTSSFSAPFPTSVAKELVKEEGKVHKKRKKKSKSNKKHKKRTKEKVESDFSSSDSDGDDGDDGDAGLTRAIDTSYQEIIHLPNGNTIIKEKKLSEGDVSWRIDKQKERDINEHDVPKYRLDVFSSSKSESKPLSRYYDDESSKIVRSNESLKAFLKGRIARDKLNPFNYVLYANATIPNFNDRIEYLYKIMETVFMDATDMSASVLFGEIVRVTWNKSNQTFEAMDRVLQKALSAHPLSYDLYTTRFHVLRSYFLSSNYSVDDIKQSYRQFAHYLLDSIEASRSLAPASTLVCCRESVLIDYHVINHAAVQYNLASTEQVVAYVQALLEFNLLMPPSATEQESLQILEEYWESECLRVGESDQQVASVASWLQRGKPDYAPGIYFDYSDLVKTSNDIVAAMQVKYPLNIFSVVTGNTLTSLNGVNDSSTKQACAAEEGEEQREEDEKQEVEEGQLEVEYKLVYSALHQQRIKVPVKSDSSMTYRQLLSRRDGGAATSKPVKRPSRYNAHSETNIQISERNLINFKLWQQHVAHSSVCYQPLRIRDHVAEYDDDFLHRIVIFDDLKSNLFLVQEGQSRMRLVVRSLQALGLCAYYSEDSNSAYHAHASNMNCSSDYILSNWMSDLESRVYHNNRAGTPNVDSSGNACVDDILSHRVLLSPIMLCPRLKRQFSASVDGTNAPQLLFILRLLLGIVDSPRLAHEAKVELLSCALHLSTEIYSLARGNAVIEAVNHEELLRAMDELVLRKAGVLQETPRVDMTVWYHRTLCALRRGDDGVVSRHFDELFYKIATEYVTAKDFSEIFQLRGAIKLYDLAMHWVGKQPMKQERKCSIIVALGNILIDGGGGYYNRHLLSTEEDGDDDDAAPACFAVDKFNHFKLSIDEEINKYKRKLYEARTAQADSVAQQLPPVVTQIDATLDVYFAVNCFIKYFFYGNYVVNMTSYALAVQQLELTDKMYRAYVYSLINLFLTKSDAVGGNLHEITALRGSMKSQVELSLLVTIERLFHARILFLIHVRSLLCPFIPDIVVGKAVFSSISDALHHFPVSTVFLSLKTHEECRQKSLQYNLRLHSTAVYTPTSVAVLVHKLVTKIWSIESNEKLLRSNGVDPALFATWSDGSIEELRNLIKNTLQNEAAKQIPMIWLLYLTLEIGSGSHEDARHVYYRALQSVAWSKDIWLFLYCLNRYNVFTEKEIDEFMSIMKARGV